MTALRRANTDLLAGIVGLSVFSVFWLARDDWRRPSAVWPETILYGLAIISLVLLVKSLFVRERSEIFGEGGKGRMIFSVFVLVAWALCVYYLGFLLGSLVCFAMLSAFVRWAELQTMQDSSQSMTLKLFSLWGGVIALEVYVLYFVFSNVLLVPLPEGILWGG